MKVRTHIPSPMMVLKLVRTGCLFLTGLLLLRLPTWDLSAEAEEMPLRTRGSICVAIPPFGRLTWLSAEDRLDRKAVSQTLYSQIESTKTFHRPPDADVISEAHSNDLSTGKIDFEKWREIGVHYVVMGRIGLRTNNQTECEVRVYETSTGLEVMGRYYVGYDDVGPLTKRIADDLVNNIAIHEKAESVHQLDEAKVSPSEKPFSNGEMVPAASAPYPLIQTRTRWQVALVIGIDKYQSVNPLANAVSDARAVAEALRKHYGFETRELYDEQATRAGILAAARQLVDDLKEGDNLLIYYAGHGWEDAKLKEGYWIPVDARGQSDYVSNAELHKHIDAMEKAQHVFIVADSCFSGAFLTRSLPDRSLGVKPTETNADANALNEFYRKMDNRKSRFVLTSGASEPVADGGRDGHSIFAYYLLRALNSPDEPVFNATKLIDRVQESVANNSAQTPLTGVMKSSGDEKGQMIFFWRN